MNDVIADLVSSLLLKDSLPAMNIFVYTREEIQAMQRLKNPFIMRVLQEGKVIYEAQSQ